MGDADLEGLAGVRSVRRQAHDHLGVVDRHQRALEGGGIVGGSGVVGGTERQGAGLLGSLLAQTDERGGRVDAGERSAGIHRVEPLDQSAGPAERTQAGDVGAGPLLHACAAHEQVRLRDRVVLGEVGGAAVGSHR